MPTHPSIAIAGLACVYPDANTPTELWENVLAQRRAFRRLPPERLRAEDYWSADMAAPDRTYSAQAAVIANYEFDRVHFRVAGSTFRSADLAHWLALDVAARALADAGFPDGRGLPRETTGVVLGNTLTGEFSRANVLRLRWPYVRRVVEAELDRENWPDGARHAFLERLESQYKSPFPPTGEDTLAGGLSNTIAGRICNHFDLKGGGYTVDGACASSLLAVANACTSLVAGDLDIALAGGVDLSLDPFELVGFAKTGALAAEEMRVFDRRSGGFWSGEGCGFVVLMRHEDALARGCRVYAVIRGWGISSDGSGGLTRPEAVGQGEALRRAYRRAGFGIDTVGYFEAHGTGTAVGDATELEALSKARHEARNDARPAAIGTIKANIGHTKAAAGLAGLLKATMVVHSQLLPPTTGCEQPHSLLCGPSAALRTLPEPENWPADGPIRAGVSAMGFGGINTHVVLESPASQRRSTISYRERLLAHSPQDGELFLFSAATAQDLEQQLKTVLDLAPGLARSELADLAARLASSLAPKLIRGAVVAASPAELAAGLKTLQSWLRKGALPRSRLSEGVFLGSGEARPRIAFLFPGQGSPTHPDGGLWRRRFDSVRNLYAQTPFPPDPDSFSTRVMQPAVVTASLAGLKLLHELGLATEAVGAIGHSLGELTALHWAGVLSEQVVVRIARVRGAAMADLGSPTGAMIAIGAAASAVEEMLHELKASNQVTEVSRKNGSDAVNGVPTGSSPRETAALEIVGYNSPRQTVVAGEGRAIEALARRAQSVGWQASLLPVSHAFHTRLVAAAVPVLSEFLRQEQFDNPCRKVVSTVTGELLGADTDVRELLCRQVTSPVKFQRALLEMVNHHGIDLFLEVGPGEVLAGLARQIAEVPALALDACGSSLRPLLAALGAAYALGAPLRHQALFADRFCRPLSLETKPKFFVNPCELAPLPPESSARPAKEPSTLPAAPVNQSDQSDTSDSSDSNPVELIRELVATRAELPLAAVKDTDRMLSDLHLNSITVGQMVSEAARRLGLPRVVGLTEFANASVAEVAQALVELKQTGATRRANHRPATPGVDTWFEFFTVELAKVPAIAPRQAFGTSVDPHQPVPARHATSEAHRHRRDCATWQVFAPTDHSFAQSLRARLIDLDEGGGVLVCLPPTPSEEHLELLLAAGRAAINTSGHKRFVLVQHGWGGSGFARTLHLETPGLTTSVINVPPAHLQAVEWILAEVASATGYSETHYDAKGRRRQPRLSWLPSSDECQSTADQSTDENGVAAGTRPSRPLPPVTRHASLSQADVLLVSGGGKGIAAECALALSRATGARLALLGRASPAEDAELAQNLDRFAAAGVRCCYVRADVTDAAAVRAAVVEAEQKLGPITALLHAAGTNTPRLVAALDLPGFQRTLAPKLQGARNLLAALKPERLKLFVGFSSIIARTGLRGEADYATANEWLTAFTERFQQQHPACRCLALEWSVWSGVGMGERLGRLDSLIQHGITPIPVDQGVRLFLQALERRLPAVALVVTGRFGKPPALRMADPELPLRRFLERPRVHYPGVELIVDAEISSTSDPYLEDHVLQKERLFPAVLGLEAMAQVAMALTGSDHPPSFEQVQLSRPVTVSSSNPTVIRLAALRRSHDLVEVCLRSDQTDFHVNHFSALCRFRVADHQSRVSLPSAICDLPFSGRARLSSRRRGRGQTGLPSSSFSSSNPSPVARYPSPLPLDARDDLYGRLLFHQGRFCRVRNYRVLTARECIAELTPSTDLPWFGPYLPNELVLGDPGARDAALHALQACIPHQRVLPIGIERLVTFQSTPPGRSAPNRTGSAGAPAGELQFWPTTGKEPITPAGASALPVRGPANPRSRAKSRRRFVHARERVRQGDTFIYDLEILDEKGSIVELWQGLRLRAVQELTPNRSWPDALLGPYVERRLEELVVPSHARVVLHRNGKPNPIEKQLQERRAKTDSSLQHAVGRTDRIWRRPDGRPVLAHPEGLSAAHAHDLTLAVSNGKDVACDLELVKARSGSVWRDLLGEDRFLLAERIGRQRKESPEAAATRLWVASECLKKAGLSPEAPLLLETETADGWVVLRSGALSIATCVLAVAHVQAPLALAVALEASHGTA